MDRHVEEEGVQNVGFGIDVNDMGCREPSKLFVASVRMRMCLDDDVLDPDQIVFVGTGKVEECLATGSMRCGRGAGFRSV